MNNDLISRSALLKMLPNDGTILTDNIRMLILTIWHGWKA